MLQLKFSGDRLWWKRGWGAGQSLGCALGCRGAREAGFGRVTRPLKGSPRGGSAENSLTPPGAGSVSTGCTHEGGELSVTSVEVSHWSRSRGMCVLALTVMEDGAFS